MADQQVSAEPPHHHELEELETGSRIPPRPEEENASVTESVSGALRAERAEAVARLAALTRSFEQIVDAADGSNSDDEHDPEGATIAFERSQVSALAQQARERIGQFDRALERLRDGAYGVCERCGRPIGDGRLEARPTATLCIACASTVSC